MKRAFTTFATFIFAAFFAMPSMAANPSLNNTFTYDGPSDAYKIENSFSSSSKGVGGVLANPAAIARSATLEVTIGMGGSPTASNIITYTVSDEDISSQFNDLTFLKAGLYFTDDPNDTSTIEFKGRDVPLSFDYRGGSGMTDIALGFNFGDVFAFGITKQRPTSFTMDTGAYTPTILKTTMDLKGQTFSGGLTVEGDGRGTFSFSGVSTTTADPLYDKFTYNSSNAAFSTNIKIANQTSDSKELILSFGGKAGSFMWGVNAIPIESNINLDNSFFTKTTSAAADMVYYVPYFNPTDVASIAAWFDESNKVYTREAGYQRFTFQLSPEAYAYRAIARGNYSASTTRVDLGLMWQPMTDVLVSMVYENIGGANLDYTGVNVFATAESYLNTTTQPSFELGQGGFWSPLSATPQSIEGMSGFTLPDNFSVVMPRKGRIGISFTKPFFLAIDYERYFTDIYYQDLTITDLGFLRVGFESTLFGLPLVFRGESRWLVKPTIYGITDPQQVADINKLFESLPIIPSELKGGIGLKAYGYEIGADMSERHDSFLYMYEGQIMDWLKTLTYDVYLKADNWDITYTCLAEPFYMASQNAGLINSGGTITQDQIKLDWINSIKIGIRF